MCAGGGWGRGHRKESHIASHTRSAGGKLSEVSVCPVVCWVMKCPVVNCPTASSTAGRASDRNARRNTDAGSNSRSDNGFFLLGTTCSADSLRCSYSPVCNCMHQHLCARYKPKHGSSY